MNPGSQEVKRLVIAVTSGTGTGTVTPTWLVTRWIRIHPVSESDTFVLTFKDGEGTIILVRTGLTGTFSENLQISLGILKTIVVTSASQDGNYVVHFDCH